MRGSCAASLALVFACAAAAQKLDPVKWSFSVETASAPPGSSVVGRLAATIEPGWHLYALATPPPSPATKITLPENTVSDKLTVYYREPKRAFDNNFNIETQTYEGTAEFLLEATLKTDAAPGPTDLIAELRNNQLACNGKLQQAKIQPVQITAHLPLELSKIIAERKFDEETPLTAKVQLPRSPVNFLRQFLPGITQLDGDVMLDVNVNGTIAQPASQWFGNRLS
jgi:hypothetical protein